MDRAILNEALELAQEILNQEATKNDICETLYVVYDHYRTRFLTERDLLEETPGDSTAWSQALRDAQTIRKYVNDTWAANLKALGGPVSS